MVDQILASLPRPADAESWPAKYALRDAELAPEQTLSEWRQALEEQLAKEHAGKINSLPELASKFAQWAAAREQLGAHATPEQIYAAAPLTCLWHLGY